MTQSSTSAPADFDAQLLDEYLTTLLGSEGVGTLKIERTQGGMSNPITS